MNGSLVADLGLGSGGLALPVAPRLRHALLQVQPVLERPEPRPAAPLRARARDDADRRATRPTTPWSAYVWLFLGSALWLVRCLLDLGLSRRPLLEPNLNASGLLCLSVGVLGLLLAETVSLPVEDGAARNPAEPSGREDRPTPAADRQANADGPAGHRDRPAAHLAEARTCRR